MVRRHEKERKDGPPAEPMARKACDFARPPGDGGATSGWFARERGDLAIAMITATEKNPSAWSGCPTGFMFS